MKQTHANTQTITAQVVNAFVTGNVGGNPAAVVLDADNLSDANMLRIAAKVGLSETAFVSASQTQAFKLDFFTPNRRIAHCGHATIATFSYLAELGRVSEGETSKETVDGPRKIVIKNGAAYMEQLGPNYRMPSDWAGDGVTAADVLKSLGINEVDLAQNISPVLVNTGNNFIVVGVKDGATLRNLKPDFDLISDISEKLDLVGYYVFTTDRDATDKDATTRMLAPRYGIEEESATGMAAGPLACVLHDHLNINKETLVIEQGRFMTPASPSLITVELTVENGKILGLMAGGHGKVSESLTIDF
ncbi:PhzF family phenazine biosynthesis protein [Thalassospira lucentensis]|uniref:PhzF family phenazine biosynthesis protein n=1 Tax=Thalassospira lucentensis TaxID=168935 RepID=A0A358HRY3_9PROT|nr:PhzF family phenazine biosynthesis protein [Thalassospira lucentensis]HBU97742.1 PhzF family phenazine biosynthesis protein [Thalassospira lucentensis]HCW66786.1 PhzF family phenazine biosynthesis protein [Thalassospira lucentensis]